MISATITFRLLVILSTIAAMVCTAIGLIERGSMSVMLAVILAWTLLFASIWCIGLFRFNRWARVFGLLGVGFVLLPMPGDPQLFSWPRRYFYDLSVFSFGAMIAMAYFSSVKDRFAPSSAEPLAGKKCGLGKGVTTLPPIPRIGS
jgi:hypothetical protein